MKLSNLFIILLFVTWAVARGAETSVESSGRFIPNSPPTNVVRTEVGNNCIVDLDQSYDLSGTLVGSMKINFRIVIHGPCGSPPGTFYEEWIAHGEYSAMTSNLTLQGPLVYLATVEADGKVSGEIRLSGAAHGTLIVSGSFQDGFMEYSGRLSN